MPVAASKGVDAADKGTGGSRISVFVGGKAGSCNPKGRGHAQGGRGHSPARELLGRKRRKRREPVAPMRDHELRKKPRSPGGAHLPAETNRESARLSFFIPHTPAYGRFHPAASGLLVTNAFRP